VEYASSVSNSAGRDHLAAAAAGAHLDPQEGATFRVQENRSRIGSGQLGVESPCLIFLL
jgi:hypothetical protein